MKANVIEHVMVALELAF